MLDRPSPTTARGPDTPGAGLTPHPAVVAPGANALTSRTFLGLLVAQFLAAFNDQAIHAAAMFYAINTRTLTERDAISLMPILFYAPWALFCTVAGYLADKYSKRHSLVAWKLAEVGITGIALVGFWMGRHGNEAWGPWVVLSTVFLMGTHSAFFVPAKYGVMPEILPAHQLSKGNGILESLSFLAVILGTVCGGVLSYLYLGREEIVGLILFALAVVGAAASLMIKRMPPANPTRRFPAYVYGPILRNVRDLVSTRPLRLAVAGIAYFTFVVAFMRAAVYMLGESQNPRWDELKTSAVVGTVALGIGLGSPLAGWLSGRRVELRLVVLGAVGMIASAAAAGLFIDRMSALVWCIIGVGFFTGFYIVPLFTLLQYKAPKQGKGDAIATSNFVNITGAITASVVFFLVIGLAQRTGLVTEVTDRTTTTGELTRLDVVRGRPVYFEVRTDDGKEYAAGTRGEEQRPLKFREVTRRVFDGNGPSVVIELEKDVDRGHRVTVSEYRVAGVTHYDLLPADEEPRPDYDQRHLPRFLFLGAAGMTLAALVFLLPTLIRVRREGV